MAVVEFETDYGPVGFAVRPVDEYGDQTVSRLQDAIAAGLSLEQALVIVKPLADAVLAQVKGIASTVDTVSAEFALALGAKGRFIVAEAEATASVKVTLTWKLPLD